MKTPITFIFFLVFQLSACVNQDVAPTQSVTQVTNNIGVNPTVYIAGTVGSAAVIWKNGSADTLGRGGLTSLFVDGTDIYAAGWKFKTIHVNKSPEEIAIATYWKNGVEVVLSDTLSNSYVHSIFVTNNHVYAVGHEENLANAQTLYFSAKYWKDGISISLSSPESDLSEANSVYVSGSDVYVAGISNKANSRILATYWKNGLPVYLTDGTKDCVAQSIFVSGDDVYVAGTVNFQDLSITGGFVLNPNASCNATYWKNGKPVSLTNGGSYGSSIFVNGTDVYVAGTIASEASATQITPFGPASPNVAIFWKNNVQINLDVDNQYSLANSISVNKNGDVYLAGMINNQAVNWVNGTRTYFTIADSRGIVSTTNSVFLTN